MTIFSMIIVPRAIKIGRHQASVIDVMGDPHYGFLVFIILFLRFLQSHKPRLSVLEGRTAKMFHSLAVGRVEGKCSWNPRIKAA